MSWKTCSFWLAAGMLGTVASTGLAQAEFDDFESYPLGEICGMGGWEKWSSSATLDVCGSVSNEQASSGSKSLKIVGAQLPGQFGDDTVQRYTAVGGQWEFSVMAYVPSTATGRGWAVFLNTYDDPPGSNSFNWSLLASMEPGTGLLTLDGSPAWATAPLVTNAWAEFKLVMDFDADLVDIFYAGNLLYSGYSWKAGVFGNSNGQPRIQAFDAYGDEFPLGISALYYDDVRLAESDTGCYADCNGDGSVNIFDFLCFQGKVTTGDPAADCNGDGNVNIFDFLCFQGAVTLGC
jgi:hypothetical protein